MLFAGPAADRQHRVADARSRAPSACRRSARRTSPGSGRVPASACRSAVGDLAATPISAALSTRGVLALEQADRADLVAERDGHSSPSTSRATSSAASSCAAETGAKTLVIATASTGPRARSRNRAVGVGVERRRSRGRRTRSRPRRSSRRPTTAARRSSGQPNSGRTAVRRRRADADHGDAAQAPALEDRVRGVRRAEHDVGDAAGVDRRRGRARPRRPRLDARRARRASWAPWPSPRAGRSRSSTTASVFVPADVDAEPQVRPARAHAAPRPARSRCRSRTRAGPRAPARAPSARSDRRGTRSR